MSGIKPTDLQVEGIKSRIEELERIAMNKLMNCISIKELIPFLNDEEIDEYYELKDMLEQYVSYEDLVTFTMENGSWLLV